MTKISLSIVCHPQQISDVLVIVRKTAGCKCRWRQVQQKRWECACMGGQAHTDQIAIAVVANLHFPNLSKYNSVFSSHYVFWIGPCEGKKKKSFCCEIQCVCQRNIIYHFKFQLWITCWLKICLIFKVTNTNSCLECALGCFIENNLLFSILKLPFGPIMNEPAALKLG